MFRNLSGYLQCWAISDAAINELFVARTTSSSSMLEIVSKISFFTSNLSTTASITNVLSFTTDSSES